MAQFYQKVKQELEKGISNVSIRSKEVLEDIKIKKQVEHLEEQINTSLRELGQAVYAMFRANLYHQEEMMQKCDSIAGLEQQLQEKKEELSLIHLHAGAALGKVYCNNCKTKLTEGAQYCGQCGQKAPAPDVSEE